MTLLKLIPKFKDCMGSGRKPGKYWLTLSNWRKLLLKVVKFEEVYIHKKEKMYYLTSIN